MYDSSEWLRTAELKVTVIINFNFTSPDVFHNYLKIYTFVQHIYNLLQSIHRLQVSALLN